MAIKSSSVNADYHKEYDLILTQSPGIEKDLILTHYPLSRGMPCEIQSLLLIGVVSADTRMSRQEYNALYD